MVTTAPGGTPSESESVLGSKMIMPAGLMAGLPVAVLKLTLRPRPGGA